MGILSKKKTEEKREETLPGYLEIDIFPISLREGDMLNALLEALQEISGLVMTSRPIERLAGTFFVIASLISGVALLITVMYLASPEGFEKRLSKVLVEKPVVKASAGEKETVEAEGGAKEKTAEEEAEAE